METILMQPKKLLWFALGLAAVAFLGMQRFKPGIISVVAGAAALRLI